MSSCMSLIPNVQRKMTMKVRIIQAHLVLPRHRRYRIKQVYDAHLYITIFYMESRTALLWQSSSAKNKSTFTFMGSKPRLEFFLHGITCTTGEGNKNFFSDEKKFAQHLPYYICLYNMCTCLPLRDYLLVTILLQSPL